MFRRICIKNIVTINDNNIGVYKPHTNMVLSIHQKYNTGTNIAMYKLYFFKAVPIHKIQMSILLNINHIQLYQHTIYYTKDNIVGYKTKC